MKSFAYWLTWRPAARAGRGSFLLVVLAAVCVLAGPAWAAEPCCAVTAVDSGSGIVTARDRASGKVLRFKVQDAKLLRSLKVGAKVWADQKAGTVSVDGAAPCCGVLDPPQIEPCCNVAVVDAKARLVQVRQRMTGALVKVRLADAAFLSRLKVGQSLNVVDIGSNRVKLEAAGQPAVEGLRQ